MEILIVSALVAIISLGGYLSLVNYRKNQDLGLTSGKIVSFLRDAQAKAVAQEDAQQWGVRFDNTGEGSIQLFNGPSFDIAESTFRIPRAVQFTDPSSGNTKDVVFSKITGEPNAATIITLSLASDPTATKTVTINAQGTITEE